MSTRTSHQALKRPAPTIRRNLCIFGHAKIVRPVRAVQDFAVRISQKCPIFSFDIEKVSFEVTKNAWVRSRPCDFEDVLKVAVKLEQRRFVQNGLIQEKLLQEVRGSIAKFLHISCACVGGFVFFCVGSILSLTMF